MKILIATLLLFPLLTQAATPVNIVTSSVKCKAEYHKEKPNMFIIQKECIRVATFMEQRRAYDGGSWYYLVGGGYKHIIQSLEKHLDKESTVMHANIGHSYILESKFVKAKKMYINYFNARGYSDSYMQDDFKLLTKLYPQHKKQLDRGLEIWNNLYNPLKEINTLLAEYSSNLEDKESVNYKKTDEEKIKYILSVVNKQEKKAFLLHAHTKQNSRLLTYLYYDLSKIYKRKKEYVKEANSYSKALNHMEIVYKKSAKRQIEMYAKGIKLFINIQDYKNALKYAVKSLELKEENLSFEHEDTIDSYFEVSSLYRRDGQYKQSIKYYKKLVDYVEDNPRVRMKDKIESFSHIAGLYSEIKDSANAIKYYKKSLDLSGVEYAWLYK